VNHGITIGTKALQGGGICEVSLYQGYPERGQVGGFGGIPDQCADLETLLQQALAQGGANKACCAGNGDQAAASDQAEATIRRTSSTAASSESMSLPLMKSSRALARDNLPEEVRGSE
jgi:hypothetical protein